MNFSTDPDLDGLQPNSDVTQNANNTLTDNLDFMSPVHISEETRKLFGIPRDAVIDPVDFSFEGTSLFPHDHGDTTTAAENQEHTQDSPCDLPEDSVVVSCADEQFHEHCYNEIETVDGVRSLNPSEYLENTSGANFAAMTQDIRT